MDSSDSIYTVYNKNEETIEYYNNDNRIYERTRDIENSINNLLIDENKQKPQNLICVYFCFFFRNIYTFYIIFKIEFSNEILLVIIPFLKPFLTA
jgi:hypothetical protein